MAASEQGTAPASARPWTGMWQGREKGTGIGHLRVREQEQSQAALDEGQGCGEVGKREQGWRLAMREQQQPGTGISHLGVGEQD